MSRLSRAAILIVLSSTILGIGLWVEDRRDDRPVAAPFARSAPPAIVSRGRIEPLGGVVAISGPPESLSTVAIVDKLLVEQGSKVAPGDVVAVISGYDLSKADYVVAQANLRVAQLQRAQLQAGIGKEAEIAAQGNVLLARRAQLQKIQKDWTRVTALAERNVASVQLLDAQRAAFDQMTQEVEQSQNTIKALTEVRPVDDALSAGQVAVAEANLARSEAAMERLRIRARQPGTVLSVQTRGGEIIGSDGIVRVGDLDHLIVVAEVDQGQVQGVKLGMVASIEGALFPEPIPAKVTRIANETYRQRRPSSDILVGRDARIVEVELTPEKPLPAVIGAEVTVRLTPSPAS